jgi:hypothetical protein
MRLKLLAAALALLALAPIPAFADPNPGDACSPNGLFQRTGGAESSGVGNMMVCSGGTWKALIGFDGTANVSLNYAVSLPGDLTPSQVTANQNDYNPTNLAIASVLRLSTDASRDITGLAGGADRGPLCSRPCRHGRDGHSATVVPLRGVEIEKGDLGNYRATERARVGLLERCRNDMLPLALKAGDPARGEPA